MTLSLPGSSLEQRDSKIFDPFVTTKGQEAGTGLGLALSQRVVTDHGGQISVEDSDLGGAAFVVELPLGR